ncbi:hypothetical protein FANTH_12215 [Fusarium anthophilum]|uniref:Uncharacterized protein n=1 Tax=Fusarium anthophilum TaxID=48485 RepID=A0A8H5DSM3_9HYPO|nr:hypothetical protein FANTH_12215 [Fusarium anthophilum]
MNERLSTRYVGGTHLTLNATFSGVVKGAVVESVFTKDDIELIGNQTRETPYAGTVDIGATDRDAGNMPSPFKPVLHCQMVLTKLNLVDEFGQVVSAFDFDRAPSDNFMDRKIYPEVSDTYACSNLVDPHGKATKIANAVVGDQENRCSFFQIPLSINQEARLNVFFVNDKDIFGKSLPPDQPYRPIYEQWENPVWGWVLANYASYGVQFFLPNGKFYGQVLLGGSTGTDIPLRWQHFEEPPRRFRIIFREFRRYYLKAFIHMIGKSLTLSKDMDPSYSESLAENQSTINDAPPQLELQDYNLPCIFGDVERGEDGMVGYFVPSSATTRKPDFSTCYTYFPQTKQKASKNTMKEITSQHYPLLKPQYADPLGLTQSLFVEPENALNSDTLDRMSSEYRKATPNSLSIFTAIINPYNPFHVRTAGLLPTKVLQIPSWTIKNALEKLDVFFPTGPVLTLDPTL